MTAEEARKITMDCGDFKIGDSTFSRKLAYQDKQIKEAAERGKRTCYLDICGTIWWEDYGQRFVDHYKSKGFGIEYKRVSGYGGTCWLVW